jgi:superoxide dismutase, Cu-Zn family
MLRIAVLTIIASSFFIGCGGPDPTILAKANLKDAMGVDVGKVTFTQKAGEPVTMTVTIATTSAAILPGEHGLHMHVGKTCVAPDFMSAGDHWNPGMMMHGHPGAGAHHAGDLGNITLGADKSGTMTLTSAEMTLLPGDDTKYINGKTIIFHANRDDGVTQMPYGNSGARLACGAIGP